jgi:hypothetical protein
MAQSQSQDVKFVRINGRVVPIRAKEGQGPSASQRQRKKMPQTSIQKSYTTPVTVEERLKTGAKYGAGFGAALGAVGGGFVAGARGAVGGAIGGALNWAILGGAGNALFGSRERKITQKK